MDRGLYFQILRGLFSKTACKTLSSILGRRSSNGRLQRVQGVAGCDWPVASRPARRRHGRLARALGSLTSVDQTSKEKNHGIEERSADSLGYFARTKERRARLAACGGLFPLDEIQLSAARVARAWFSWFRCKGSLRG